MMTSPIGEIEIVITIFVESVKYDIIADRIIMGTTDQYWDHATYHSIKSNKEPVLYIYLDPPLPLWLPCG